MKARLLYFIVLFSRRLLLSSSISLIILAKIKLSRALCEQLNHTLLVQNFHNYILIKRFSAIFLAHLPNEILIEDLILFCEYTWKAPASPGSTQ